MGHFVFWGFLPIISQLLSDGGRSADFPVRRKLLSHNRAANWVQVGVRTMLRTGKSALRDLRPRSLRSCEKIENTRRNRYKHDWESTTCESGSRKFLIFSHLLTGYPRLRTLVDGARPLRDSSNQ